MSRVIDQVFEDSEVCQKFGITFRRNIGNQRLSHLDPFLLLDVFELKQSIMPYHPHRGFESVTYMLEGSLKHKDLLGNATVIKHGDFQWMTTGRGIMHCEIHKGSRSCYGINVWIILAEEHKMIEPVYWKMADKHIPTISRNGVTVKVLAGESMGIKSEVSTVQPILFLDFKMDTGTFLDQHIPCGWTGFVYILSGEAMFGPPGQFQKGSVGHTLVLGPGISLHVENKGPEICRFLVVAGQPLNEPIVHDQSFVVNTREELQQAWTDYRTCKNGFENAKKMNSNTYHHNCGDLCVVL